MKLQAANVASTATIEEGMIEMPRYKSHKTVWALEIASIEEGGFDSTTDENRMIVVHFVDSRFAPKLINLYGKPTPQAGWYMVAYKDDYISFSPKQQFEEGYTRIPASFKDRVAEEKRDLDEKADKLDAFRAGSIFPTLPEAEQERLNRQLSFMRSYSGVLADRIAAF